jgi:hypothetical protein
VKLTVAPAIGTPRTSTADEIRSGFPSAAGEIGAVTNESDIGIEDRRDWV